MKFRYKITLCMISMLAIFYGIGGTVLISGSFRSALEREKEGARDSYQMILDTLQVLNQSGQWQDENMVSDVLKQLSREGSTSWAALQLQGKEKVLYQSGNIWDYFLDQRQQLESGICRISNFSDDAGRKYLQVSGIVSFGEEQLVLNAAYDITSIYETREAQQRVYTRVYFSMLGICLVIVYLIAYMLTRPLSKLSKATRRLASGNLSYRSMIKSDDEIGSLAQDFNQMAEHLEKNVDAMQETVERQEQFMGSFAHELKTPMTSIIGYADLIRRQTLSTEEEAEAANYIYTEGKRLERLSHKMLDIVSIDKGKLTFVMVSPETIIHELTEYLRPIYQKSEIRIEEQCEAGSCLLEPDLFRSLLINLLDNSRKAMVDKGGQITIELKLLPDGCQLEVADDGPGATKEDMQRLTEAFYRVDKARSRKLGGAGLGLTLCERIAELHQGTIQFADNLPHGMRVIVVLRGGREHEETSKAN